MELNKNLSLETVKSEIGSSPLGFIKGLMAQGSRLSFALCIAVYLYVTGAKDKKKKADRIAAVKDILTVYGSGSMAYTLLNIGGLVVTFNLSSADVDKRTRILKENMKDFQALGSREAFLAKVTEIENREKATLEVAKLAARKALEGSKDSPDAETEDAAKVSPMKAEKSHSVSADDALAFLTISGKELMLPLYAAFGKRPGDAEFKAGEFIAFILQTAATACKVPTMQTGNKVSGKVKTKVA